jgi:CheY-like chemotaxis protein
MTDKITSLIVEDESIALQTLKEMLQRQGFRCATADTEAKAKQIIERGFYPETALVDYLIPEGHIAESLDSESFGLTRGLRLARYIQKVTEGRCRIVLMTGLWDFREKALETEVWGYCSKPIFKVDKLIEMLKKGYLKEDEIGKPTINLDIEFNSRNIERNHY